MAQRKLTKAELQRQIEQKEQMFESDFHALTDEARERLGLYLKIAVPVSIAALAAVGVTAWKTWSLWNLTIRRAQRESAWPPSLRNELNELGLIRVRPVSYGSMLVSAVLVGAGVLLGGSIGGSRLTSTSTRSTN